jgi:NADPH-dependent ferric siderophore reductase
VTTLIPLTNAEVKSLVEHWFFLLDVHADVREVLPLLVDSGLEMRLPEATLHNHEEFVSWYEGVIRVFFDEVHVMQSLQISLSEDRSAANIDLVVKWLAKRWSSPAARSEWLGFDVAQHWVVVRSPQTQKPVIRTYTVNTLTPMGGSVAL